MSYISVNDIKQLLGPYKETSQYLLADSDITAIRKRINGEIDFIIVKYAIRDSVPIASTDEPLFTFICSISSWGSIASALGIIFPDSQVGDFWYAKYLAGLETLKPQSATDSSQVVPNRALPSSYFIQNKDSEAELGYLEGKSLFTVDNEDIKPW